MSSEHQRFAVRVLEGFAAAGRDTDAEVAKVGGPSSTKMTQLRKVAAGVGELALRSDTLRRIDSAAGWPEGSAKALWLRGVNPVATEQADDPEPADDHVGQLEARIIAVERRLHVIESLLKKAGIGRGTPAKKSLTEVEVREHPERMTVITDPDDVIEIN